MEANDPNPYAPPGGEPPPMVDKDARLYATLAHLLGIFTGFIGPLIIWLLKKDESPFVDDQGKEALNFQITILLGHLVSGLLWCVVVGVFFTIGIAIMDVVLCILATVAANKGEAYRYPICLRLVK